jgi:glutamine amidotransferase
MPAPKVTIIDYGMGNLLSVRRALEHLGAEVRLGSAAEDLRYADCVVLPGVGAFGEAHQELKRLGLIEALREFAAAGTPLLGICLGAQLLLDESDEFGRHPGLGLIPGRVEAIPKASENGQSLKIPHMGWADLRPIAGQSFDHPLLAGIDANSAVYFVHSFQCRPISPQHLAAACDYHGVPISALVAHGSIFGCQFHPEKSGPIGLKILENFLELAA